MHLSTRINRRSLGIAMAVALLALALASAAAYAGGLTSGGPGADDKPIPVEPDGGIGTTPGRRRWRGQSIPVEPDGGIGSTPDGAGRPGPTTSRSRSNRTAASARRPTISRSRSSRTAGSAPRRSPSPRSSPPAPGSPGAVPCPGRPQTRAVGLAVTGPSFRRPVMGLEVPDSGPNRTGNGPLVGPAVPSPARGTVHVRPAVPGAVGGVRGGTGRVADRPWCAPGPAAPSPQPSTDASSRASTAGSSTSTTRRNSLRDGSITPANRSSAPGPRPVRFARCRTDAPRRARAGPPGPAGRRPRPAAPGRAPSSGRGVGGGPVQLLDRPPASRHEPDDRCRHASVPEQRPERRLDPLLEPRAHRRILRAPAATPRAPRPASSRAPGAPPRPRPRTPSSIAADGPRRDARRRHLLLELEDDPLGELLADPRDRHQHRLVLLEDRELEVGARARARRSPARPSAPRRSR